MKKFIVWAVIMTSILGIGMYFLVSDANSKNEKKSDIPNKIVNETNDNVEVKKDDHKSNDLSKTITAISQIKFENKNDIMKIKGVISKIEKGKKNDMFLTVEDDSGDILVPIFKDKDIERDSLEVGVEIEVVGKVDIYNNALEIIPEYKSDVEIINKEVVNQNDDVVNQNESLDNQNEEVIDKIENSNKKYSSEVIDESKIDETVLVEGDVLSKYNHDDGHVFIYIKTNGNEKLNIPIFSNINYDSSNLNIGSNVSISGKVKTYKGQIQVIPQNNYDIKIN